MSGDRIQGLDAWRSGLMLGGIVLHGSLLQEQRPLFDAIALISGSFRMGVFFAISGFLAATSLAHRDALEWRDRRYLQLIPPTAFGLLVICPAISLLFTLHRGGGLRMMTFDMHHLWFLVALLAYTRIAYWLNERERQHPLLPRLEHWLCCHRHAQLYVIIGVGGATFAPMIAARYGLTSMPRMQQGPHIWHLQQIAGYAPMFVLGMVMARSPAIRGAMIGRAARPGAVLAMFAVAYVVWYAGLPTGTGARYTWGDEFLRTAGAAFCPPAAAMLIFRSVVAVREVPPVVSRICAASFTMYIVHLPLIVVLNIGFSRVGWNVYVEYLIVLALTAGMSFVLHHQLVARSRLLALLLNGTPWPKPRPHRPPVAGGTTPLA